MKIELKTIKVSQLIESDFDKQEARVGDHGGVLSYRSAYQREFIYGEKQRNEAIHTVRKNAPSGRNRVTP